MMKKLLFLLPILILCMASPVFASPGVWTFYKSFQDPGKTPVNFNVDVNTDKYDYRVRLSNGASNPAFSISDVRGVVVLWNGQETCSLTDATPMGSIIMNLNTFNSQSHTGTIPIQLTKGIGYDIPSVVKLNVERREKTLVIGNKNDVAVGSYVRLGDKIWRLIGTNKLLFNDITNSVNWSRDYTVTLGIGKYLNTTFLDSLGAEKQYGVTNDYNYIYKQGWNEWYNSSTISVISTKVGYLNEYDSHTLQEAGNFYLGADKEWFTLGYKGSNGGGGEYAIVDKGAATPDPNSTYEIWQDLHYVPLVSKPLRPVVHIDPTLHFLGTGTQADPYRINHQPEITISAPTPCVNLLPTDSITLSGTVKDQDIGQKLKVYYRLDGIAGQTTGAVQAGTDITVTGLDQPFDSTVISLSGLQNIGLHYLNVWVVDDGQMAASETVLPFYTTSTPQTGSDAPTFEVPVGSSFTIRAMGEFSGPDSVAVAGDSDSPYTGKVTATPQTGMGYTILTSTTGNGFSSEGTKFVTFGTGSNQVKINFCVVKAPSATAVTTVRFPN